MRRRNKTRPRTTTKSTEISTNRTIKTLNKEKRSPIAMKKPSRTSTTTPTIANIGDDIDIVGGGKKKLITYIDKKAAKPIAEDLFKRAKDIAYSAGVVGEYLRRSIYYLIYHDVAGVLGKKKSVIIAELTERSGMSRSGIDNLRVAAETEILFDLDQGKWSVNALIKLYRIQDQEVKKLTVEYMKHVAEKHGLYMGEINVSDVSDTIAYELSKDIRLSPEQRVSENKKKIFKEYKNYLMTEEDDEDELNRQLELHKEFAEQAANQGFLGDIDKFTRWRIEQYEKKFQDRTNFKPTDKELVQNFRKKTEEAWTTKKAYEYIDKSLNKYTEAEISKLYNLLVSKNKVIEDAAKIWRYFEMGNLMLLTAKLGEKLDKSDLSRDNNKKRRTRSSSLINIKLTPPRKS